MKPLHFTTCRHALLALAAIAGLFLTAGCGSSSHTPPNQQGSGNGSLSGTYVFSSSGVDSNVGLFLTMAGTFTANGTGGTGGITGGMIDINGFSLTGPISTAITSGSYNVGSDGRGQAVLNFSGGSVTLDFVLNAGSGGASTPSSHGLVTEFDGNGTGSGTLDLQGSGSLTGFYSFGLTGATSLNSSLSMVGTFDSGAADLSKPAGVPAGLADINSGGDVPGGLAGLTLVATVAGGSPGSATLVASSGGSTVATYNFHVYTIDSTHLKFIETDTAQIMAGDAFTQQTSLPQGVYAYTMTGLDTESPPEPMALAGFFTSDGSSGINTGLEDYNDAGSIGQVTGFGGSFTPFSGGRTELTLNGIYNGVSGVSSNVIFAAYPSSGGIQLLEIGSPGSGSPGGLITGGFALSQGSVGTLAAQGYGLNLSAVNSQSEEDDIAEFVVNSSNAYNGAEDINDDGTLTSAARFDGTVTSNSAAPGYGAAASSSGQINFNYYLANGGSTALILETDTNQLGVGSFDLQSSSAASSMQSHFTVVPRASAKGAGKRGQ